MNNRICEAGVTAAPAYNKATTCGTEPTQLATVTIPASKGGDGPNDPFKPTLGAWRNTIVFYAKNNAVYLYDVNGVFTNLTGTDWGAEIAKVLAQINDLNTQLSSLSEKLELEVTDLQQGDAQLGNRITALQTSLEGELQAVNDTLTNLSSEVANASSIANQATQDVATEALTRGKAVSDLQAALATEVTARETADGTVQEQVNANAAAIAELQEDNAGEGVALNKTVVYEVGSGSDASTVNLAVKLGQLNEDTVSDQTVPLPVASEIQAGVMNASMYATFQGLINSVEAIQGGVVEIGGLAADVSQDDLSEAWKTATGKTELINQAKIFDSTNKKIWTYYANTQQWVAQDAGGESVSVSQATNTSLGIVMGSTEPGQCAVEGDGRLSVNEWDTYTGKVDTNTVNLAALTSRVGDIPEMLEALASGAGVTVGA